MDPEVTSSYFKGKKITVMGLGLLGRGVGDAGFLAACGADVLVTDIASAAHLEPSLRALAKFPNITYRLGEHVLEDFQDADLIIKAAGVRDDSPFLVEARRHNIPVRMSTDLFAELSGLPIIGITGTRGKTTTTYLVQAMLEEAGVNVLLGGNVPNISTLALLPQAPAAQVAVLELDSWQLQGFGAQHHSPHISVITTFYPDHLKYYRGNLHQYLADKAHIFLHQQPTDTLIIGAQALEFVAQAYPAAAARAHIATADITKGWSLKVPGAHNRYNAACAYEAARAWGVSEDMARAAAARFMGVPGRLELVRTHNNIRVYNDTTAVIPEATCAGLEALADAPITLILGGNDKGNDIKKLTDTIDRYAAHTILLPGTGSNRIAAAIPQAQQCDTLQQALQRAIQCTEPGGVILFSPAFSSRGMFANPHDRGAQFVATLNSIWTI